MPAIWKFRLVALLIMLIVGFISSVNLAAEFLGPARPPLPWEINHSPTSEQVSSAALAARIAPFRSDLVSDHALALADQALKSDIKGQPEILNAVQSALKIAPHESRMWLVLALVQTRTNPVDPLIGASLKMSYLTGPNQTELVPIRLEAVTANNALSDADLRELARSDVRALLTRLPEQRQNLANDYARASDIGKKFLEENVAAVDPGSVNLLRKK
jgi:hypothetical protein